jgi:methyl-accepting chemotaxis protein
MAVDEAKIKIRELGSLKFRLTLFFIFFFIAVFSVFTITSLLQINTVIRFVCSRIALPALTRTAEIIDGDQFEALSKSLDPRDPFYEETRLKMLEIKERVNCRYLYTMAPVGGSIFRYIIDGSAPPDDTENFSPLGTEEDVSSYDSAFMETVRTKETLVGTIDQNELWGTIVSVYTPILNSSNKLVGIIGCDLEADSITAWIRTQAIWQIAVVAGFILLGVVVYISLLRKLDQVFELNNTSL